MENTFPVVLTCVCTVYKKNEAVLSTEAVGKTQNDLSFNDP